MSDIIEYMPKAEELHTPQKNLLHTVEPLNMTGRLFFGFAVIINGQVQSMFRTSSIAEKAANNLNNVTKDKPFTVKEINKDEYYEVVGGTTLRHDTNTSYDSKNVRGDGLYEEK